MPTEPDVAAALAALREAVRVRRAASGADAPDPLRDELRRALDAVEVTRVVSAHWPLSATTLPGKLVAQVNKVVRRLLRWYINPIVEQQNSYNVAVARALRLFAEAYDDLGRTDSPLPPRSTLERGPGGEVGEPQDPAARSLQHQIATRGRAEPAARFVELDLVALGPHLAQRAHVHAHWPLDGQFALVQKLVRQYLRWLINPIVEQQNGANAAIVDTLAVLTRRDDELRARAAVRRARRQQ